MGRFDGVTWPKLTVLAGFGGTIDEGAGYLHLGTGPGLGTGKLGGLAMVDITGDVRAVSWSRGRDSPIDSASPGACTILLGNASGDYDPENPNSPYVNRNQLTANQSSLEDGTTAGWEVGSNCTIANSTSGSPPDGTRALQLTSVASGDMWAQTPLAFGSKFRVWPSRPYSVTAEFRAATVARSCRVSVWWYDVNEVFLTAFDTTLTADTTTGWTQVAKTDGVSPVNAWYGAVVVRVFATGGAGEVHRVDKIGLIQGASTTWKAGGDVGTLTVGAPVKVRAEKPLGTLYERFDGVITDIALSLSPDPDPTVTLTCADGLETLGRAQLAATSLQFDGDRTGVRVGRVLDAAGWPSAYRALDTGYTTLAATTLGDTALELARKTEQTEFGLLFVDGGGRVVFYDRHRATTATRSTTVQAALTDTGGAGEVAMATLTVALSRERTYNDVHITREPVGQPLVAGGGAEQGPEDTPAEQVATDAASALRHGTLSLPAQVGQLSRNDADALALAQYLAWRFADVSTRIREVRVNALRGDLWAVLLPLGLLDRISVRRDYGPNTITAQLLVQAVTEEIRVSPPQWDLVFTTSPPPPAPSLWVLGTTAIGAGRLGW